METEQLLNTIRTREKIENQHFNKFVNWTFTNANLNQVDDFEFDHCVFESQVWLDGLEGNERTIKFENCEFRDALIIRTINVFSIEFNNCLLRDVLIIESKSIVIECMNCSVNKNFHFQDVDCEELYIDVSPEKGIGQIIIAGKAPDTFDLRTFDSVGELILRVAKKVDITGGLKKLLIDTNQFEYISYQNLSKDRRVILGELEMTNQYFTGNLLFEELDIDKLYFENVTCKSGTVRFNDLDIKKAHFDNVNIDSFSWNQVSFLQDLKISGCNFSSLIYSNTNWLPGKKVSLSFLDDVVPLFYGLRKSRMSEDEVYSKEEIIELQNERETYKQLKAAAIANHNNIEALDFYRNEMRLYWKEIRINGGIPNQNRILIFLNRWSSDFGQNWMLPIMWLVVFHALWFSCILGWRYCSNQLSGSEEFTEFAKLLNPTHENPAYVTTGWGYITDIIMRISIGYFVYHLIRATRKYGKI